MMMLHADLSFRCLDLTWVIWPLEKSNTSSLSNLRIAMLFWQRLSLVRLAPTMSLMKVGQCLGHSCFRIWEQCKEAALSVTGLLASLDSQRICLPEQESCWAWRCKLPPSANEHQNSNISMWRLKFHLQSAAFPLMLDHLHVGRIRWCLDNQPNNIFLDPWKHKQFNKVFQKW